MFEQKEKKRVDAFKEQRNELENLDENELDSDSSSYSYRHLNREKPTADENKTNTNSTSNNDQGGSANDSAKILEKYKTVNKTKWTIFVAFFCFTLIIAVTLILYFFVFRNL